MSDHAERRSIPGIFRLPLHLRLRIYVDAGAPQGQFINLNMSCERWSLRGYRLREVGACRPPHLSALYLLLTCRSIYHELGGLIYSKNHFFIRYRDAGKLEGLRRISSAFIRQMKHLTIHLNVAACGLGDPCDYFLIPWRTHTESCFRGGDCLHDEPLRLRDHRTQVKKISPTAP